MVLSQSVIETLQLKCYIYVILYPGCIRVYYMLFMLCCLIYSQGAKQNKTKPCISSSLPGNKRMRKIIQLCYYIPTNTNCHIYV